MHLSEVFVFFTLAFLFHYCFQCLPKDKGVIYLGDHIDDSFFLKSLWKFSVWLDVHQYLLFIKSVYSLKKKIVVKIRRLENERISLGNSLTIPSLLIDP